MSFHGSIENTDISTFTCGFVTTVLINRCSSNARVATLVDRDIVEEYPRNYPSGMLVQHSLFRIPESTTYAMLRIYDSFWKLGDPFLEPSPGFNNPSSVIPALREEATSAL
jgi:hypothetical protein